jgi:abortive infection bacteriophage resistance protein
MCPTGGRFIFGVIVMEQRQLKQAATYDEQIAKLREHGCVVEDEAFCKEVLAKISYYRLSAYFLPFRTVGGKYKSDTTFSKVYNLYEFDRKLRRLIFTAIEEVEVYLRAQLSHFHAHKYGSDGYMDAVYFNAKHDSGGFEERINDLIRVNSKSALVSHHLKNYGGKMPLWAIMELFSFGMLSYFFVDMLKPDQKYIARSAFGTTNLNVKSWLYCCTGLRNLCAHYGRLYYRIFTAVPAKLPHITQKTENSLFANIMALRALYPDAKKWNNEFMSSMVALFDEYAQIIELRHIGFSEDWAEIMRKDESLSVKPTI